MRLPLLLLALLANVAFQRQFSVVWTDDDELTFLTPEEHRVAFRDVIIEGMVERVFEVFLAASRLRDHRTFDPKMLINDPQQIEDEIKFKKTETGLIDVEFKAWDLQIREEFLYFRNTYNIAALQHSYCGYFSLNILYFNTFINALSKMIEILLQRGSWSRNILFCFTAVAIIALLLHVKLTVSLGGCHHTTYHPALNLIFLVDFMVWSW